MVHRVLGFQLQRSELKSYDFVELKVQVGFKTSRKRVSALTATLPLADAVLLYKDLQNDAKPSGTERLKFATQRAFKRTPA